MTDDEANQAALNAYRRQQGQAVLRALGITIVVILAIGGLVLIAGVILMCMAMSNFGSNK